MSRCRNRGAGKRIFSRDKTAHVFDIGQNGMMRMFCGIYSKAVTPGRTTGRAKFLRIARRGTGSIPVAPGRTGSIFGVSRKTGGRTDQLGFAGLSGVSRPTCSPDLDSPDGEAISIAVVPGGRGVSRRMTQGPGAVAPGRACEKRSDVFSPPTGRWLTPVLAGGSGGSGGMQPGTKRKPTNRAGTRDFIVFFMGRPKNFFTGQPGD